MPPQDLASGPKFTVFIRLPFPRGDFVDPPPVNWDVRNDRILWDVLSVAPKEGVDSNKATFLSAEDFNVTLPFLLQHVAWLYDRRLSQVRAQFRKVGHQNPLSGQTTSAGGGTPGGSVPMNRSGSDGMGNQRKEDGRDIPLKPPVLGSRIQSRLFALQRDISATRADSSCPPTPNISQAPNFPRPLTTKTHGEGVATLQKHSRPSSGEVPQVRGRGESRTNALPSRQDEESPGPLSSSSSGSSSDDDSNRPQYRRFGKFSTVQKRVLQKNDEDDEDDSPAFLPLESIHDGGKGAPLGDPASTLREAPHHVKHQGRQLSGGTTPPAKARQDFPESSTTSSSSGMATGSPANGPPASRRPAAPLGPLSPRRTAELAGRSPYGRGSEGTPSMGSSFSDLDDASVSQSALEEALLSNMQRSGVTSRMSTISQALRSRYL
ncbi:Atg29p [Microsporum canis CBS 113480]|uniref:Autophagy-related protein 29 n=1 Tax=Arthroderma otae (strain ATCC MYA-4605 / CBS 113480) TaxID=554155 RepID=C5FZ81_ARTOC|nr:Atg29p [Microsporum canis CBS 113480]EEQ35184.1 Atg29p [Microsporum canis CBS 113480]